MAEAVVFVDDAVRGRLPSLCTKDGTPTTDWLRVHEGVGGNGGPGIAWLLLLAGPLGWLVLLAISVLRDRREVLHVELPYSEAAYQRMVAARRSLRIFGAVALASTGALAFGVVLRTAPVLPGRPLFLLLVVVACVGLVMTINASRRLDAASVGVSLDASRRWVTLSGVHPAFAAAAKEQADAHH